MRLIIYVMLLLYPFSLLPAASGGKKEKNLSDEELMMLSWIPGKRVSITTLVSNR